MGKSEKVKILFTILKNNCKHHKRKKEKDLTKADVSYHHFFFCNLKDSKGPCNTETCPLLREP